MASHNKTIKPIKSGFTPQPVTCKYLWQLVSAENENTLIGKLCTFLRGGLWCARLDTFNDPLEGTLPIPNVGLLRKVLGEKQSEMAEKIYKKAVLRSFASCWHMSEDAPSIYAWCAFGGGGNGIAIRTMPDNLRNNVVNKLNDGQKACCYLGRVQYIDHALAEIKDGNVIEPAFCVQKKYQRENEARLLIHTSSLHQEATGETGPFGSLFQKKFKNLAPLDISDGDDTDEELEVTMKSGNDGFAGGHAGGKAVVACFNTQDITICIGDGVSKSTCNRIIDLCQKLHFPLRKICRVSLQQESLSESEIRFRAFEKWRDRNCPARDDWKDWFDAETELCKRFLLDERPQ